MKNFYNDTVRFVAMGDNEVYGVLYIKGNEVESGFYRTSNKESALRIALMNNFSFNDAVTIYNDLTA